MTNTYQGLHARWYDLIYADKPYREEAAFVDRLLREDGRVTGRLLEIACGTGRHAVEFARLGWAVTGVDYSPDLLLHARARSADIDWLEQDMRKLDVPGRPFDAVTCLFDSIGYPQSDEGVIAALRGAHGHLASGGIFAAEFLHAPALTAGASPLRVKRWSVDDVELVRISETELEGSVMHVSYELIELRGGDGWTRGSEVQSNRSFEVDEMEALIRAAGFAEPRFVAAYGDGLVGEDTFHVMALAHRD